MRIIHNAVAPSFSSSLLEEMAPVAFVLLCLVTVATRAQGHMEGDIRLVNGSSYFYGVPQIYLNGNWKTICDHYLHHQIAKTICKQLYQYTYALVFGSKWHFGNWSDDIFCAEGDPYQLNDCWTSTLPECPNQRGLVCQAIPFDKGLPTGPSVIEKEEYYNADIRLNHNGAPFDGVPEMYVGGGNFTIICDDQIRPDVGRVICRQLGFPSNNVTLKANIDFNGTWNNDLDCSYDYPELDRLDKCLMTFPPPQIDCPNQQGLICNGNLHLHARSVSSDWCDDDADYVVLDAPPSRCIQLTKQIQIYVNGTFTPICVTDPYVAVAKVICRQMGLLRDSDSPGLSYGHTFNTMKGTFYLSCTGNEENHEQCTRKKTIVPCSPENTLGVNCNATDIYVELLEDRYIDCNSLSPGGNTSDHTSCRFRNRTRTPWVTFKNSSGMLCVPADYNPTLNEQLVKLSQVACFSNGYSRYDTIAETVSYVPAIHVGSTVLVEEGDLLCTGHEQSADECTRHVRFGRKTCNSQGSPYHVVKIACALPIRLMHGGPTRSSGLLMLEEDATREWKYLHVDNADSNLAHVVCGQLGYTDFFDGIPPGSVHHGSREHSADILNVSVHCMGLERFVRDCLITDQEGTGELVSDVVGIDCGDSFVVVEPSKTIHNSITGIPVILNISGHEHMVCVDTLGLDYYINMAAVFCYSQGYSRFYAKPLAVPPPENSSGVRPPVRLSMQCSGEENSITSCTLTDGLQDEFNCKEVLSVSCKASSVCVTPHDVPAQQPLQCWRDTCYVEKNCDDPVTFRGELENCTMMAACSTYASLPGGYTALRGQLTDHYSCIEACSPYFHSYAIQVCCYTDECNNSSATELYSYTGNVMLHEIFVGAFIPYDGRGLVAIPDSGETYYLPEYGNYTEEFLAWLCRKSGHLVWEAAVLSSGLYPADQEDPVCVKDFDADECMERGDLIHCAGVIEQCDQPVLGVNCRANMATVRLVDGGTPFMGRVEIYFNSTWGTICSDGFGLESARVICRSLGYPGGCSRDSVSDPTVRFLPSDRETFFHSVQCQGHEKNMWYCDYKFTRSPCNGHDVGIICAETEEERDWDSTEKTMCLYGSCTGETCGELTQSLHECVVTGKGYCFVSKMESPSGKSTFNLGCRLGACTDASSSILQLSESGNATYCCYGDFCFDERLFGYVLHKVSTPEPEAAFDNPVSIGGGGGRGGGAAASHDGTFNVILLSVVYAVLNHY